MNLPETAEVVVVGGGPAGCATALGLAQRGVTRVLVTEAGSYEDPRVGECLLPDTRPLLERLGVWDDFRAQGHEPCLGSRSSWGSEEFGYNDFVFNPLGHGWHLDRRVFDASLARRVAELGARLCTGAKFMGCDRSPSDGLRLRFGGPGKAMQEVRARFVVDATGKRSAVARRMGARTLDHDRLVSVYGFFDTPPSADRLRLTMLEAVEYGWWYAARLPGRRLAAAVTCDPATVRRLRLHEAAHWLNRLRETRLLGPGRGFGTLANLLVCTTPSFRLDAAAGDRWLAVGDAASPYDPICSQGIHKALADGLDAANAVADRLDGDRAALENYRERIEARHNDYAIMRQYLYDLENRWPSSPFWSGRHSNGRV